MHTVTYQKNQHQFIFRFSADSADCVIEEAMMLADTGEWGFDWIDAAAVGMDVTSCVEDAPAQIPSEFEIE
jgi:hypothetical protein